MLPLGLTVAQQKDLMYLLTNNHFLQIGLQILKLDHTYLSDVSTRLMTGQVSIDEEGQDATRSLSLTLIDPFHQLKLDGQSPDEGSLYYNKMVKVNYGVYAPDRSRGYWIPVFTGPMTKAERDDALITVTCAGKEKLMGSNLWVSKTYKKGIKRTDAIKDMLRYVGGETKYDIPDLGHRLAKDCTFTRETTAWAAAKLMANGIGYQLFYDGRGVCRMRIAPGSNTFTFSDKATLLTEPQPSFDAESAINAVQVTGAVPKGAKTNVYYRITAPASHPLSPWALGRNGVPRFLPLTISDDTLKTVAACKTRAQNELSNALIESTDVAFDSLPVPMLEEQDYCTVKNDSWSSTFRLTKMTIPLVASGTSAVGYLKPVFATAVRSGGYGGGGGVVRTRKKKKKRKKR